MLFENKSDFKRKWINDIKVKTTVSDESYLSNLFDKYYSENSISFNNSVSGKDFDLKPYRFIKELDNYVMCENGAFYMQHNDKLSSLFTPIVSNRATRDYYKKLMFNAKQEKDFVNVGNYNTKQSNVKVTSNALYGSMINPFSPFYNYDIASSITIRGRSTVSLNSLTLESMLGSYRPYKVEIILDMIDKIINKDIDNSILDKIDINPTDDQILLNLLKHHYESYYGKLILINRIKDLSLNERKLVFYANNAKDFFKIPYVQELMRTISYKMKLNYPEYRKLDDDPKRFNKWRDLIYLDPGKPPACIKTEVEEYSNMARQLLFGYFWYGADMNKYGEKLYNTQDSFKELKREVILLNDTDSKIYYLNNGIDMIKNIDGVYDNLKEYGDEMVDFILGSFIIHTVDECIIEGLDRYTSQCNISKEYRGIVQYKYEYFFRYLQPTKGAKNYIGFITIQEGNFLPIPEIDLKGLPLKKSNFNKSMAELAKDVAINDIATVEKPDIKHILSKVHKYRMHLVENFKKEDNLEIFTPFKLNEKPKDILPSDHRLKAVNLFNTLFGDTELGKIEIPGVFLMTKIDFTNKEDYIKEHYKKEYDRLVKYTKNMSFNRLKDKYLDNKNKLMNNPKFAVNNEVQEYFDEVDTLVLKRRYTDDKVKDFKTEWRKRNKVYKNDNLRLAINALELRTVNIKDISKIALPIDSNFVPKFITEFVDLTDITVFDNLIATLIEGLGILCVRNNGDGKGRQMITNVVKYY